ncbi:MAG: hypothetical protein K9N23_02845 [Akkermansiaceae bacterium]|nr:hypothetical protein [Akkermansiaceae bacterium]MCF7996191.1 hypothetical protein [Chromatiaceae bacterium]
MKPSLFLNATRFRRKLRFLWCSWFCPQILVDERERKLLNRELRGHWPERQLQVYELIHEQWDPDEDLDSDDTDERFIVFVDHELAIDWITKKNLSCDKSRSVALAEAVGARRCNHLPQEQVLELKRLVGQAVACSIQGNSKEAAAITKQASNFLEARTTERSRYWSLLSAHLLFGATVVLSVNLWPNASDAMNHPNGIGFGALGGYLGAYLSLLQRTGKGAWDSAAGPWIHLVEIFTKLLAGVILGGAAICLAKSAHAPPSLKAITSDSYSVFMLGLAAGFIERLIPRLISQYSNNLSKISDEPKSDHN